jgi:DNA-directed RNA polymerase specialized sigma24 family protein
MNLVRRHLDQRIFRREDEQDVLQSMFASFCHGQSTGKTAPASREELWKLLVRITMCKVVNTAHRHTADRRDIRRERGDPQGDPGDPRFPKWMLDHVDRSLPAPDERAAAVEEIQRILKLLPDPLRQIVVWKLEGFTNAEISCMIGRTVRSVEIKLQLIRKHLEGELGRIDLDRKSPSSGANGEPASDPDRPAGD